MHQKLGLLRRAREVKGKFHKSYLEQLWEVASLRLGFSRLGADDYYQFKLYRKSLTPEQKREFIGWRCQSAIDRLLNDQRWHFAHSDKIITTLLMERLAAPIPSLRAVFDRRPREIPGCRFLRTLDELGTFLKGLERPLFVKPVNNALGRNAFIVEGLDAAGGTVLLAKGKTIALADLHRVCVAEASEGRGGMLFQDLVRPSAELTRLTGDRLCSLRMIMLERRRLLLTHAVLKLPVGGNITDNFRGGSSGNLLGRINLTTGALEAVFGLRGDSFEEVERHPDTGAPFAGVSLPDWNSYVETVTRVASAFPGMRLQHWDIAVSDRGPLILELNGDGCVQLPQIAYQRGLYAGELAQAVREARGKLPRQLPGWEPVPATPGGTIAR